jgi:amidase
MTDMHNLSALQQAAAIRAGEFSPAEIVAHYLDRIDRLNDALGAFITVTPDLAVAQARAATERIAAGTDDLPPLFGVPTAIKDLATTAGVTTTLGSRAFADQVPDTDAHIVSALRAAGTISLGKTNTPEFGTSPYTDNDLVGPARSPWDARCSAGGSSGGAAAAVAAGLVPFAHGSDGGGSIRIPASVCGLVGIKPSRGRISNGPVGTDAHGLSVQGPLARTVRDAAAMLDAMSGTLPGDLFSAPPLPEGETFIGQADRDPGRLRVGRYAKPANGAVPDDACLRALDDVSKKMQSLGHDVIEIDAPFDGSVAGFFNTIWGVKALDTQVAADDEALLRPVTRAWREYGRTVSGADYAAAVTGMLRATRRALLLTEGLDIVLTPTLGRPPQLIEHFSEDGDIMENLRRQGEFTPFTAVYNMTGQPAVSLPLHWTEAGVPIGVSLVGQPFGEATLISAAAQLEAAFPWADRHPDCW